MTWIWMMDTFSINGGELTSAVVTTLYKSNLGVIRTEINKSISVGWCVDSETCVGQEMGLGFEVGSWGPETKNVLVENI